MKDENFLLIIGFLDAAFALRSMNFVFQNIGIYSECLNEKQFNRSEFNKASTLLKEDFNT